MYGINAFQYSSRCWEIELKDTQKRFKSNDFTRTICFAKFEWNMILTVERKYDA